MNNFFKQFGGRITQDIKAKFEQSPNWRNGCFQNLEDTTLTVNLTDFPRVIRKQLSNGHLRRPKSPLPVEPFNLDAFLAASEKCKFIWYGHSAILMRIGGKNLLIDPMLGPDTTPIAPIPTRRFSEGTLDHADEFPEIDLILMTHDHYDHLDYQSIQKLKHKTKQYYVSLGVKRHLVRWGVQPDLIKEFDWWNSHDFHDIKITFTPTRHFSGRGFTDRSKTLWGGWIIKTDNEKIWFSGDGGYGSHFKEIGRREGPFDFAFMECGQYNDDWRLIHLFPEEAIQAAIDAGVRKAMPVHWAGFSLSYQHTWEEPVEVFLKNATDNNLDYVIPALGQLIDTTSNTRDKWWTKYIYSSE